MWHKKQLNTPLAYSTKIVVASVVLASTLSSVASATEYFRYINNTGVLVIDSHLPPEYVSKGYSVLNEQGLLVREVPPELTEAQRIARKADIEAEKKKQAQRRKDEQLLVRYSSLADIDASEARIVDEISIRVSIMRSNVRTLKKQIEKQQEIAANIERGGRKVPQRLVDNIAVMEAEVDATRDNIQARKKESVEVNKKYTVEKERFAYLQALRYGKRSK